MDAPSHSFCVRSFWYLYSGDNRGDNKMKKFNDWVKDLPEGLQLALFMICAPVIVGTSAFLVFLIASLWHALYLKWWL